MSEHLPNPEHEREIHRIELELAPLVEHYEDREDGAYELSGFTQRINAELGRLGVYVALYLDGEPLRAESNFQGQRRVFDEEHINAAILEAAKNESTIEDDAARVIASLLHTGQASSMYALSSNGAITEDLFSEIDSAIKDETLDPLARSWAEKLKQYVETRVVNGQVEPVHGWSHLWLGSEAGIVTSAWIDDDDWPEPRGEV